MTRPGFKGVPPPLNKWCIAPWLNSCASLWLATVLPSVGHPISPMIKEICEIMLCFQLEVDTLHHASTHWWVWAQSVREWEVIRNQWLVYTSVRLSRVCEPTWHTIIRISSNLQPLTFCGSLAAWKAAKIASRVASNTFVYVNPLSLKKKRTWSKKTLFLSKRFFWLGTGLSSKKG